MCTPGGRPGVPMRRRALRKRRLAMTLTLVRFVVGLARQDEGQDLIEYALLAGTIALGVTAAMLFLRDQLNTEFSNIGNSITAGS